MPQRWSFSPICDPPRFFFKNPALSLLYPYDALTSCKKLDKTNEQSLRYLKTDTHTPEVQNQISISNIWTIKYLVRPDVINTKLAWYQLFVAFGLCFSVYEYFVKSCEFSKFEVYTWSRTLNSLKTGLEVAQSSMIRFTNWHTFNDPVVYNHWYKTSNTHIVFLQ